MTDEHKEIEPGFQWKWVVLSLFIYLIFYFLPLMSVPGGIISGGGTNELSIYIMGIWGTAGVFIIAAVMAYYSPGITVWEVVVSAVGVVVLMVVVLSLETNELVISSTSDIAGFSMVLVVVFAMSYMGGWWGEKLQNIKDIIKDFPMEIEAEEDEQENDEGANA